MTYFLPSYFQKRLLRYALTRLDFIDADDLNLEDLDIKFGQRSTVELKNVGVKVKRVTDTLQLPTTIVAKRALVKILRISVPADLHASGIEIQIDGVDIEFEVQESEDSQIPESTRHQRRDATSQERIFQSPSVPDSSTSQTSVSPSGQMLPTSKDLAESFLETEPRQEREELEAALQSRSYLHESTSSLASGEDEETTGMGSAFSLPGFVANFFAGVADRLSLVVKNVYVLLGLHTSRDDGGGETIKIVLKLAELSLRGLDQTVDPSHDLKRRVGLSGIEVFVVSEAESMSQQSASTSPKTGQTLPRVTNTILSGFDAAELTSDRRNRPLLDQSDTASSVSTVSDPHMVNQPRNLLDSTILDGAQSSEGQQNWQVPPIGFGSFAEEQVAVIDNRQHAEDAVLRFNPDTTSLASLHPVDTHEDLTESRMFSHDEAESMYMSAISTSFEQRGMPGSWNLSRGAVSEASRAGSGQTSEAGFGARAFAQIDDSITNRSMNNLREEDQSVHPTMQDLTHRGLMAKRILIVDRVDAYIPQPRRNLAKENLHEVGNSATGQTNVQWHNTNTIESQKFPASQSEHQHGIGIERVLVFLDISIVRTLIKTFAVVNRLLPKANPPEKATAPSAELFVRSGIQEFRLNFYQSIQENSIARSNEQIRLQGESESVALLYVSLSKVKYEFAKVQSNSEQTFSIWKIIIGQGSRKYLYFVDRTNLQEPVAASVLVKPDDLVVMNRNERFDVHLKPLKALIDLVQVDDVLSRSGGLSSLMDLGASVASAGTGKSDPKMSNTGVQRRRSVHFEADTIRSSDFTTTGKGPKIDVRLSGLFAELKGSETLIQLKTSAVKMNLRPNAVRAQIDHASLAGPLVEGSQSAPEIAVELKDILVSYSNTPSDDDLDRLLSLLTPSRDSYSRDDDIMVDTLIRQRRKGGVLRLSTKTVRCEVHGVNWVHHMSRLADELSRLAAVSKYLPEDDRPGVLTFGLINTLEVCFDLGERFGTLNLNVTYQEGAHINVPALMAAQISSVRITRNKGDVLVGEVISNLQNSQLTGPPMLMVRFIADEMEPTVRAKLSNTQFEYRVSTVTAFTNVANELRRALSRTRGAGSPPMSELSSIHSEASEFSRKVRFSLAVRNSTVAMNAEPGPGKGLFVLSDAQFTYHSRHGSVNARCDLHKASILIINDAVKIGRESWNVDHKLYFEENDQVQELTKAGYVPVGSIANASALVKVIEDKVVGTSLIDVEFRNNLFLLETCADSTQTLIQILSGLAPPSTPPAVAKYRTEIVPIQDLLASFTGDAFVTEPGPELGRAASQLTSASASREDRDLDECYEDESEDEEEEDPNLVYSFTESEASQSITGHAVHVAPVNVVAELEDAMGESVMAHSMLDFQTDHFTQNTTVGGTAHRWDSTKNTYDLGSETEVQLSPLKIRVREVHIIWHLFDGYDWQSTRETITQAVEDIEAKVAQRQNRRERQRSPVEDDEDKSVIGDFLFNSIYIGVPANKDAHDLRTAINYDVGDISSETGSYTTGTTITANATTRTGARLGIPRKRLRLNRSRAHKMTFELKGLSADILAFPPGTGEVESSVDIRVHTLEIFDNIPTSTWKKFATYMREAGEREVDTNMIHIELLNVRPVVELSASELVLKITVLPLRLHVDQDALDFLTRFFEFKDASTTSSTPSAPPFLQRVEVNPVKVKLDFKPKRVDYAGLRSGKTTEFMNFFVLDRADMVLRRVILYGVSGFDRLGIMLNNIWSPDVRRNQLPGVLAGIAPIRSLVDVGSGVKDLVAIPIREYKKDGRIVRSIQKGALAFAKTTTTELVNLGAKLAIGTQAILENTEEMLVPKAGDDSDNSKELISLYADQPLGIVQGLRGAYASLERDLLLARDAIVAVPGEVMASEGATGAAKAVLRQSPTIILRPAIGASRAVGQALLGAGNTLDRGNLRRIEEKYKRH